jgi:type I restriction enzyme S subunit
MEKLLPQLRFPEFKGEWENSKLKNNITSIDSGWSPQCEDYPSSIEEWGVLKTTSVVWEGFNENQNKKLPKKLKPKENIEVVANDILITRAGPTNRVGVTVHVDIVRSKLMLSDKIIRLKTNEENASKFISIILSNDKSKKQILSKSSGLATSQTNISQNILLNVKMVKPSLPEQTKIASFLTAVDAKLTALKQKKTLLEQYKKGVMQQIFSQELRFKDDTSTSLGTGSGNDYADWEEKKLGEVCEIVGGGTPETIKEEFWNGNIQWFTPTEIKSDFVSKSIRTITELGLKKSSAKLLPVGTILLTTRATIGEVALAKEICSTNQGFQSLITKKDNSNIYIFNWIKENKFELLKRANGSTFPEISKSEVEQILLPIPCLKEQTKIANFLSSIDEKINYCQAQIEKTTIWKKGLLQQLFV